LSDTALAIWSDSASVALYLYPREGYTTHVSLAPVPLPAHKIGARGYNAYGYELPYEVWRGAVVARLSLSCGTRYIISERSVYRGRTMLSSIRGLSL
ncbi:MAG: hypothetical protein NZ571_16320, partial [Anaerolineae bacterium]|nr:hypothetical protein [Anaerolineae bacterium]